MAENSTELNFWEMTNLSTCEYESTMGCSAWAEWDRITDSSDDEDDSSNDDSSSDDK